MGVEDEATTGGVIGRGVVAVIAIGVELVARAGVTCAWLGCTQAAASKAKHQCAHAHLMVARTPPRLWRRAIGQQLLRLAL